MQKIFCDLCGNIINEEDIRYIEFNKYVDKDIAPVHPILEICAICVVNAHKRVMHVQEQK